MVGAQGPSNSEDFSALARSRVASPGRLAAVRSTGLLETDPEPAFDRIAALAARLFAAPMAFVTVVDDAERRRRYPGSDGDHLAMGSQGSVVVPVCIGSDTDIDALASELATGHHRSCEELATDVVERFVDPTALADDVALVEVGL